MMTRRSKKITYNVILLLIIAAAAIWVISRFAHFGNVEYTDNAQVRQHIVPQNSYVRGFIKEVRFEEYQQVHKGDTLVIIEDSEFRLRLAQAEADLANALVGKNVATSAISTTANNEQVNDAGIEEVKAQLQNAEVEKQRYVKLFEKEAVTPQQYDRINTQYEALKARYEQITRQRRSTALVKNEQTTRLGQNEAVIKLAEAAVDLAKLNMSYTVIVATCDGVTGRKDIHEGQLVQPGQTMVVLVDTSKKWVVANYRETQMKNIAEGSEVEMKVDAVPDVVFHGNVTSISEATGAQFSLVPQDNATGNFVKVEQRVPVLIDFDDSSRERMSLLRSGMNVICEIKY
ncbi:MAG: HlyD family secretion protein [Muribaculaceae bacterium]